MIFFFRSGGPYMWLLLILMLVIVVLAVKKTIELFTKNPDLPGLERGINAVLFWGVMSFVAGVFAHFHGIYLAMQAIMRANDISPAIVAGGYAVSLITILAGLFILMFSSVVWFLLRWKYKSLLSAKSENY